MKVEITANEIVLEGMKNLPSIIFGALLKDFIQKTGIKGKVKKGNRRKTHAIFKPYQNYSKLSKLRLQLQCG